MGLFFGKKKTEYPQGPTAEEILEEGMVTVRDIIAPGGIQIESDHMVVGEYFVRTLFVYSYTRYLYTEWLSPVINADFSLNTSIFIYPIPTPETLKKLRNKAAQMEATISEDAMKGKVRDPLMETAEQDVEELRTSLQSGESKLFRVSFYLTIYAKSKEELDSQTETLETILGGNVVLTKNAIFQQEPGFNASLPICKDELQISKNFDTGSLSTMFPFLSSDLSRNEGILYGQSVHSGGLVIFDRFSLENANSVVLAKSGSGKSYAVKLEILRYMLFGTEIIVIDPENEFERLCHSFGGSYLDININSNYRINPFDLPQQIPGEKNEEAKDNLRTTIIMLHGLIKVMLKGKITSLEENLLDQAINQAYASKGITGDPQTHSLEPPIMEDLVSTLSSIKGAERLVAALDKFSKGTYSGIFNQRTNIDMENRFIVFSIRDLEDELRPMAMFMILNFIWNRVKSSRRKRILAIDEAWILMKHEDSAQFLFSMAKRARKYYLGVTTIIQDVEDFLGSKYGKAVINNSSMTLLLKQHPAAIDMVVKTFNLTQAEKYSLLNAQVGEGLFFAGQDHVGIVIPSSYQEDLLATTNPEQLNKLEAK